MSDHPCLHAIPGGKSSDADVLDRERRDGVGEAGGLLEHAAVGKCQCETRAERVAGARRIHHAISRETGYEDLPPVA